jgi:hypothetical protein
MFRILLIVVCFLSLAACQNVPIWQYRMFERPPGNKPYPPMYLKGWQDGCESGAQASGNYLYRLKYKFRQDWELLDDQEYVNGWENAYDHCRKYILQQNLRYNSLGSEGGGQ